jgi:hypothetical protein
LTDLHVEIDIDSVMFVSDIWSSFYGLFCDVETINATYKNNHSLSLLKFEFSTRREDIYDEIIEQIKEGDMPSDIASLLQMNHHENKSEVARR